RVAEDRAVALNDLIESLLDQLPLSEVHVGGESVHPAQGRCLVRALRRQVRRARVRSIRAALAEHGTDHCAAKAKSIASVTVHVPGVVLELVAVEVGAQALLPGLTDLGTTVLTVDLHVL